MPYVRPDGKKLCPRCRRDLVAEGNFYRCKSTGDGFGGYCIRCTREKADAWDEANPEKKAAKDSRHLRSNPERRRKMRERLDRWARENPEKAKASHAAAADRHAKRHPDRRRETFRRYARSPKRRAGLRAWRRKPENLLKHRDRERMRRATFRTQHHQVASRLGVPASRFTMLDWWAVIERCGGACAYCGSEEEPTMDHVVPVAEVGAEAAHVRGNIVLACRSCNSSKKDRALEVFCAERGIDPGAILSLARA